MALREGRVEFDSGVVCERCLVADSFRLRLRGLLGRRSIAGDEGLLLVGSPSIHTTFMRFPIDALFLDRELAVIGIRPDLKPWRIAGRWKAKHILELRAGEAARRGVGLGAHLRLIEPASAPTTSLQPRKDPVSIRVLVGASDRRFLRVASFLLGRSGFAVANATRLPDLMDAVEHGRADVVVLVGDGVGGAAATLPKWGSFDQLVDEIRAAHARREPAEVLSA